MVQTIQREFRSRSPETDAGTAESLGSHSVGKAQWSPAITLAKSRLALYYGRRSFTTCAVSLFFVGWISAGEGVSLPRPRIQVVHGRVPQKCARNSLPARSGILYRPAIEELRCHRRP